jgi:hypothetical protein
MFLFPYVFFFIGDSFTSTHLLLLTSILFLFTSRVWPGKALSTVPGYSQWDNARPEAKSLSHIGRP